MTGALLKEVGTKALGGAASGAAAAGSSVAVHKASDRGKREQPAEQPAARKKSLSGNERGSVLRLATKAAPSPGKIKEKFKPGGLGGSKVLVAEFIACMVLVGVQPILGQTTEAAAWLKKGAAITGLFLVLSLVASGGPRASKISAAFGGLVTLALLINSRDVLNGVIALLGGDGGSEDIGADDLGAAGEAEVE